MSLLILFVHFRNMQIVIFIILGGGGFNCDSIVNAFSLETLSSSKVGESVNLKSEMYLVSLRSFNHNTSRLINAHQSLHHSFLRAIRVDFNCKMLNLTIKGFVLLKACPNRKC